MTPTAAHPYGEADGRQTDAGRALEELIDRHGLQATVQALADIAYAKATHLEHNWQDRVAAKVWDKDGRTLDAAAAKIAAS